MATTVRVAAIQYAMHAVASFDEFAARCRHFAALAGEFGCDFAVWPELLTNQLIPLTPPGSAPERARALDAFTAQYVALFQGLAQEFRVNLLAGTHLTLQGDRLQNVAWLFHRDGRVDTQAKMHITPAEVDAWQVQAGETWQVFETDCGRVAIPICYDIEFPEYSRLAREAGADLFLVPYNTDLRSGHIRVRTCAHARCIENNVYVVLAGMAGALSAPGWSEIHYARSAILTPSDIPFARDGIAIEADDNTDAFLVADLDLGLLHRMQAAGTVRTWVDRRHDLYEVRVPQPSASPKPR